MKQLKKCGTLVMKQWREFIIIFDESEYDSNETCLQFVNRVLYWKHVRGNAPWETNDHLPLGGSGAEFVSRGDEQAAESYWEYLTA